MNTGIIILAAGSSSRLGKPKQLLEYKGKSLLKNVTKHALKITGAVVVVTGFNHASIEKEISKMHVLNAYNPDWQEGMGSSINVGIQKIRNEFPDIHNVIISVCDQPFIDSSVFSELIDTYKKSQKGIVASSYSDILGTPVLFHSKYIGELAKLSGNEGAKKLLRQYQEDVTSISFEKGNIDIDTQNDYEQLIQNDDISTGS